MGIKETLRIVETYRQPEVQTSVGIGECLRQLTVKHGNVNIQTFTAMISTDVVVGSANFTPTQFVTDGLITPSYLRDMRYGIVPLDFDLIDGTYVAWSGYPKQSVRGLLFRPKPLEHFIQTSFSTKDFRRIISEYHLPSSITIHYDSHWGVRPTRRRQRQITLSEKLGLFPKDF